MKLLLSILVILGANMAYAGDYTISCAPELGDGEEIIEVSIELAKSRASITVDGNEVCTDGKVSGKFVEYGKALVKINCAGAKVTVQQDYDETVLDISSLKLGLSDTRYMCD